MASASTTVEPHSSPTHQAKRQKPNPTTPKVIDLTKNLQGDLVILAGQGEDGILIRTHGVAIRLASTVFAAMFGGRFVESSTKYTEDHPLKLVDDDPKAMDDILSLLHHQYATTDSVPMSRIPALLVVADKYDCVGAIRPWFQMALAHYRIPVLQELQDYGLGRLDAACLAFVLGDSKFFWEMTKRIVFHSATGADDFLDKTNKGIIELMPRAFLGRLKELQTYERHRLIENVRECERKLLANVSSNLYGGRLCDRALHMLGVLNFALWEKNMHTMSNSFGATKTSLGAAWEVVKEVDKKYMGSRSIRPRAHARFCSACDRDELQTNFDQSIVISRDKCQGLCLVCLRTDKSMDFGKTCEHNPGA